jgi:mucin-19
MNRLSDQFNRNKFIVTSFLIAILLFIQVSPIIPVQAAAVLSVTPITWNVVGLDSNNVNVGPNNFPVGARVCNTGDAASNVTATFVWDNGGDLYNEPTSYINLRTGSLSSLTTSASAGNPAGYLAAGTAANPTCADFYFEVSVTRNSLAYDTTRRFHIDISATGLATISTPIPREIYVEHLISQNRNSTNTVSYGLGINLDPATLTPVAVGGTMTLLIGNTYTIRLDASTATQGYNQLEDFINFPNTIFQVLKVSSHYSADSSGYISNASDKLYADACLWDMDPTSPTYLSCIGSDGKTGGTISTTYEVKIIGGAGTNQSLNTLIYDFSGSSFHYNSDYSSSLRTVAVTSPLLMTKSFSPASTTSAGFSTLSIAISNSNSSDVTNVSLTDNFPSGLKVYSTPNVTTTATNCLTPSFSPHTPLADETSFTYTGGVKANSTCTISMNVYGAMGTYINTTQPLVINSINTGITSSANLIVEAAPSASSCTQVTIADWVVPSSGTPPPTATTPYGDTALAYTNSATSQNSFTTNGWTMKDPASDGTGGTLKPINLATDKYYRFQVGTANYTNIKMTFSFNKSSTGVKSLDLYYGNNGTVPPSNLTQMAQYTPTTGVQTVTDLGIPGASTVGDTYFYLFAYNNQNNGSGSISVNNIKFTGCRPPQTLTKSFSPDPITLTGTSNLTFTMHNYDVSPVTLAAFTDTLPAGLTLASDIAVPSQCGGTVTALANTSTISLANGTIPANGVCTFVVSVKASAVGNYSNVSGYLSGRVGSTDYTFSTKAADTLAVISPPVITKSFSPNPIYAGGNSTLTLTVTNPNAATQLTNVSFTDTLPTNVLSYNTPASLTTTCTYTDALGATVPVVPTSTTTSVSMTGAELLAGASCVVNIGVTSSIANTTANPSYNNSVTASSTQTGSGTAGTSKLVVQAVHPGISLLKEVSSSPTGPWANSLNVSPGGDVYYRLTMENTGDVPLNPVSITDTTSPSNPAIDSAIAACTWPTVLPVGSSTSDPTATCITGKITAVTGTNSNTATAHGTYNGNVYDSLLKTATYETTSVQLIKSASPTSFSAADTPITYTYTITNLGATPLTDVFRLFDSNMSGFSCLLDGTLPVNQGDTVTLAAKSGSSNADTIVCTGTYRTTAFDVSVGSVTNTAYATFGSSLTNMDRETVYINQPDLVISKTNNVGGYTTTGAGGIFNWTIRVANQGPMPATFVNGATILKDQLPTTGATYGTLTYKTAGTYAGITNPANINCAIATNLLTCTASGADVTVGASGGYFDITIPVTPSATGILSNSSAIVDPPTSTVTESNEGNNTVGNSVNVSASADLAVTKTDGVSTLTSGATVTYTIVVTNNGPSAANNAVFTDPAVDNLTVTSVTCTGVTGGGVCPTTLTVPLLQNSGLVIPTLPSLATVTFRVIGTAGSSGSIVNNAYINPPSGVSDPTVSNNWATDLDTIGSVSPDLTIAKSHTPSGGGSVGNSFTWILTARNSGTGAALFANGQTILRDTLPANATFGTPTIGNFTDITNSTYIKCSIAVGVLTCTATGGSVIMEAPTGSFTVSFDTTPTLAGSLSNSASIDPNNSVTESNEGNNTSNTDTLTITGTALVTPTIAKAFNPATISSGGTSTITFTLTNPNTTDLTAATFTDTLANMSISGAQSAAGTCTGASSNSFANAATSLTFSGITIPASSSCTVTVLVTSSHVGANPNSTSGITSTEASIGSPSASVYLTVLAKPTIVKSFNPATISSGSTSTITFTLTNANSIDLTAATFTDTLTNMTISGAQNAGGTCTGASSNAFADGATGLQTFSGLTIPANSVACTVTVVVTSSHDGTNPNTASGVTTAETTIGSPSASVDLIVLAKPTIVKAFNPVAITTGGTSTITFTLTNSNNGSLTNATFTDSLANMSISGVQNAGGTCTGASTNSFTNGATNLSFSGITLPASGSCTVTVLVTSSVVGVNPNSTSGITTAQTTVGLPSSSVDLTVLAKPTIAKAFSPATISSGGTSTITFTLANSNTASLTSATFTDTLANMSISGAQNAGGTCTGASTNNFTNGATNLTFSGITIPASGNCAVTVLVTSSTVGTHPNSTSGITTGQSTVGSPSGSVDLTVLAKPTIAKAFSPATISSGGTSTITFTLTNANTSNLTLATFTDTLTNMSVSGTQNAGGSCTGASTNTFTDGTTGLLTFSGITIPANSVTCTVTILVSSNHSGVNPNSASGVTTFETTIGSPSSSVDLTVLAQPTIEKAFSPATITTGGTSTITFTLTNSNTSSLTNASFSDTLANMSIRGAQNAGGTCVGASTNSFLNGATGLNLSGITIPASGSCTVTVLVTSSSVGVNPNSTSGVTTNLTTIGTPSVAVDLTVLARPSIVKAFDPVMISTGDTSTITFTLSNANPTSLTSATFTDSLTNMSISGAQNAGGTCAGASTNSFTNGTANLSFSGITIPASGSCTVTILITSSTAGTHPNTASGITTAETTIGAQSASVDLTVLTKPTISKAFSPATISWTGTSTITFTLANTNPIDLTSASFTDTLANMSISGAQSASGTCTGAGSNSFLNGATNLTFNGITIPAGGSCTTTVLVTSSTVGDNPNATSGVTTSETTIGSPSASVDLTVLAPPTIAKVFNPDTITTGGNSTITFTLTNSNASALTNATFTDNMSNMAIRSTQNAGGTCVGANTNNFTLGTTSLNFSGITIPAINSCTVTVQVTSSTVGVNPNSTSGVTTNQTLPGAVSSSVNLTVLARPTIAKAFNPATITSGGTSTVTFTLANTNASNLTSATFTDSLTNMAISGAQNAGGTCTGANSNSFTNGETALTFDGITIPAGSSCTVTILVTSNMVGTHPNSASGIITADTTIGLSSASVNLMVTAVAAPAIAVVKSSTTTAITAANQVVPYTFTVTNPGNTDLTGVTVTDALCDSGPAYNSGDSNSDSTLQQTETWLYSCSHAVTQTEFDAGGTLTNTATAHSNESPDSTGTRVIDILGTITGTVWNDLNGNGTMDPGELPLAGVTVSLYDNANTLIGTAVTAADGTYLFSDLTDGNYTVIETDRTGYSSTTSNTVHTIIASGSHRTLDFGDLQITPPSGTGSITGIVINDTNGDGIRNGAEGPIPGVNLNLLDQGGSIIRTTTSAADGSYTFSTLPPGQYSVVESDPVGYVSTTLNTISVFLTGSQVADVNYFDQVTTGANIIDPAVTKQGSPESAVVGDEVVYTITVGNIGNQTASNVVLVDTKPAFLDIMSITINPDPGVTPSISGNTFSINFGTMLPGDSFTVTVITRVGTTGTPPGGANQVVVTNDPANLTDRIQNNSASAALAITIPPTGGGGGPDDDEENGELPSRIPQTGFAPGEVSLYEPDIKAIEYSSTNFQLIIPSIGIKSPLVGVPKHLSDWDIAWLGEDVGYLQGTAFPSLAGNSVISGHVYDRNGNPGPFSKLGNLKWGDTIELHGFGHKYIYEVRTISEVAPENVAYVFHHEELSWLTLFTCKNFDEKTGTYQSRIVVKAVLTQIAEE